MCYVLRKTWIQIGKTLVASAANGNQLDLEIIANARGLDLLRVDTTPFAARITELTEKYDNLSILDCSRAIKRLQDLGIKVKLVPDAGNCTICTWSNRRPTEAGLGLY